LTQGEAESQPLPGRLDPRLGKGSSRSAASDGPRNGRRDRGGRRRGHRAAVIARVVGAVLSVLVLAGSGWGWYLARVAEASVNRTDAIPTTGNSDVNGQKHAGAEMNLLLVGMDSRQGLTPQQQDEYATGDPGGLHNTDTMMLVHIPADGSAASFVSFPRDMYVPIAGHGEGKLNSAYGSGYNAANGDDRAKDAAGAQVLIQTISQISGLQIDHFAEINLLGFINLSNIVGGVTVDICQATDDPVTGAHFDAGVQTLSGSQALLFVRQRHGLTSDFDRVARQQVYIAGMLRNLLSSNLLINLSKQKQVVRQVGSSVTLDQGLNVFDLASQMQSVQPGNITFQTIPGLTDGTADGWGSVLMLPSQQILTTFFSTLTAGDAASSSSAAPTTSAAAPTKTVPPSQVTVSVLNGSGITGAASTAATALTQAGFHASSGGNATRTGTTIIRYRTGDDATAATLAAKIPGAILTADDTLTAGQLTLTLGADFTAVGQHVTAAPTSTSADPTAVPGAYANKERTAADTSCIN
jgi:LCP family protein required for cell wall assembly